MDSLIIFEFILAFLEFFIFTSHLNVHLGLKNSRHNFLKKQLYYFAADGTLTLIHLIYFWNSYYFFRILLIYAVLVHFYYCIDIKFYQAQSRIFYWSSINIDECRFSFKFLKENIETFIDCLCHGVAAYMFISSLKFYLTRFIAVFFGLILTYKLQITQKYFLMEKHMIPKWMVRFLTKINLLK